MMAETIKTAEALLMHLCSKGASAEIDMSEQKTPVHGFMVVVTFSVHGRESRAWEFVSSLDIKYSKESPFEKTYQRLAAESETFILQQIGRVS